MLRKVVFCPWSDLSGVGGGLRKSPKRLGYAGRLPLVEAKAENFRTTAEFLLSDNYWVIVFASQGLICKLQVGGCSGCQASALWVFDFLFLTL